MLSPSLALLPPPLLVCCLFPEDEAPANIHTHAKKDVAQPAARGLSWLPRRQFSSFGNSISAFGSSVDVAAAAVAQAITILQLEQQVLAQAQLEQEIALTQAIQLQLQSQEQLNLALDNIRINTFNNLNNQVVSTPSLPLRLC
jgi:hypothetical protein